MDFQEEGTYIHTTYYLQCPLFLAFNQALARDGYRCMLSGMFDGESVLHCADLKAMAHTMWVDVQTSHILNDSTMQDIDPVGIRENSTVNNARSQSLPLSPRLYSTIIRTHYATGAMAMLEQFGFSNLTEAFKQSGGVHQVWNLLSLEYNLHSKFNRLELWFESTDKVCHSEICQSCQLTGV